jgi:hypothetical protein
MVTYRWTLYRPHHEPAAGFGELTDLALWLTVRVLPGSAPVVWVIDIS